jgi:hypothetical protein
VSQVIRLPVHLCLYLGTRHILLPAAGPYAIATSKACKALGCGRLLLLTESIAVFAACPVGESAESRYRRRFTRALVIRREASLYEQFDKRRRQP